MKLYFKILRFLKPYWKQVIITTLLTFGYVFFNTLSLWVSVDFIGELFPKTNTESNVFNKQEASQEGVTEKLQNHSSNVPLYQKVKGKIKNILIQDNQYDTLKIICIFIFISFLIKNGFDYFRKVINNFIQLKIIINIRNELQHVAMHLPLNYFNENHTARLTSIIFNDIKSIQQVLHNSFGKLFLAPIQILANILILILISWKLALLTLIVIPVSGVIIVKIGQSMRRKSRRVFQQISEVVSIFQEAVSAIRIVKAFTSEKREIEKFERANQQFFITQFRAHKLGNATSPLNEICGVMILVALLWYGSNLVYAGGLVADDFIRFLVYLFAMFQPLKQFSGLNNVLQRGLAAAERIFEILDNPQEIYERPDSITLKAFQDSININHVSFRYAPESPLVLNNIQLEIKKGETIAFVGPSGSGKTTLVNLLPHFYDVTNGEIFIDGVNIRNYSLLSLRNQIGIVTQDTFLFNDTIFYNIAYGVNKVSETKIIEAAKIANAYEFIEKMEDGLHTIIGERGLKLSGGQKQRLSIARAILKNPPILILDEATSSLDTQSERLVQDAIEKLMKNRTVLAIAHRLSTVIHADKIVVLHDGEIIGIGPHEQLLETCDLYRNLYEIQFKSEVSDF